MKIGNYGGSGKSFNLGYFETSVALIAAYPTAVAGSFAVVGDTDTIWVWDVEGNAWKNTSIPPSPSSGPETITFSTDFSNLSRFFNAGAYISGISEFGIQMSTGSSANTSKDIYWGLPSNTNNNYLFSRKLKCSFTCAIGSKPSAGGDIYWGTAVDMAGVYKDYTKNQIGFKIVYSGGVGNIYATNGNGVSETYTDLGITVSSWQNFTLMYKLTPGVDIKFYANGAGGTPVLLATHTTNLPSVTASVNPLVWGITNNANAINVNSYMSNFSYEITI